MPYVMNRYVIPLVIMSVLTVVFFFGLVYCTVFAIPEVTTGKLDAERKNSATSTKLDEYIGENGKQTQLINLLGGEKADLEQVFETTFPSGAVTYTVWTDHIANSKTIRPLTSPEPTKQTWIPQSNMKFDNLAQYVRALEADIVYLEDQVSLKETARQKNATDLMSLEREVSVLYTKVLADKPAPPTAKEQIASISATVLDMKNTISTLTGTVKDLGDKLTAANELLAGIDAKHTAEIDAVRKERDQNAKDRDDYQVKAEGLAQQVNDLQIQLGKIIKEQQGSETLVAGGQIGENLELTPAGAVIMVKGRGMDAVGAIDIGSKKLAKNGMVFRVLSNGAEKARIQIYQVDENASYFRVLGLATPNTFILEGDPVSSPFYRGGQPVPQEFVLVGEFPDPLTKERIIDRIKEWGGAVSDKIGANTKYVILGQGVIGDEVRKDLQLYNNIQRISIATVRDFFGE